MATSVFVYRHLRRCHFSLLRPLLSLPVPVPVPSPNVPQSHSSTADFTPSPFFEAAASFRYFSSRSSDSGFPTHEINSVTESELRSLGFTDGAQISYADYDLLDDSVLPIHAVVSLLDGGW